MSALLQAVFFLVFLNWFLPFANWSFQAPSSSETTCKKLHFKTFFFISYFLQRPIWKKALKKHAASSARTAAKVTTTTARPGQKKVQIRLALIMSFTVLEFNIFQMPLSILVLAVLYQTLTGMVTIPHEFETIALSFIWVDSIMNPLWTAFISKKPKKNKIETHKLVYLTPNGNNTNNNNNSSNSKISQDCQSSSTTRSHGFADSWKV